jgi:hypothetical protein
MIGYLESAIERKLGEGWTALARYEEGSYQGNARIFAISADGLTFADGEISWGSCSICDPWYDMSEDEVANDLDRAVDTLKGRSQIIAYLTGIARLDKDLGPWDHDATAARQALIEYTR